MNSLIEMNGIGEVLNNLINKLSGAVGWIVNRDTPSKIAIEAYIADIKASNLEPLTKAALISQARKNLKEYCNQNNIFNIAVANMSNTAKPEAVEDNWLALLFDKARLVSDENFQLIWGKILAEECNSPGSIPKTLLHILEHMDKNDAEAFSNVCSVSVYIENDSSKEFTPIITSQNFKDYYNEIGLNYDSLVNLQAIGLIEMKMDPFTAGYSMNSLTSPIIIHYHGKNFEFPKEITEFQVGNVIFTKSGSALCKAIDYKEEREGFFEQYCAPMWKLQIANSEKVQQ